MMNKKTRYFAVIIVFVLLFFFWWLLYIFFYYPENNLEPIQVPDSFFSSDSSREIYFASTEELIDWQMVSTELQLSLSPPRGFLSALKKRYIISSGGDEGFYYLLEFSGFIKALAFYLQNSIDKADWNQEKTAFVSKGRFFAMGGQFVGVAFSWLKPESQGFLLHQQTMQNLEKSVLSFPVAKDFSAVEFRTLNWESIQLEDSLWLSFTDDFGLFLLEPQSFTNSFSPLIIERTFQSGSYAALRGYSKQSISVLYLRRHPEFVACITDFGFSLSLTQKIYLRRFL